MRRVRITFVARLFGELSTTVAPERVPYVIKKLWANDNAEVLRIKLLEGPETHA